MSRHLVSVTEMPTPTMEEDFRRARASQFTSQIMAVVGDFVSDKPAAFDALWKAAYGADAVIVNFDEARRS
jgi:hypothetical protein